ncbi:MAG: stage V sporulation protein AD [Eubacteriales bacterium]|nr:stage V sporulation protein AD [Lachnospiraceae bacterium]MDO5126298.1 stage V sporulation protein AD [Eubacteriales bacterium]
MSNSSNDLKLSNQQVGKQSIKFQRPPIILSSASIVGSMEGQGPLSSYFDQIEPDPTFGQSSWEEGESEMVRRAVQTAITKSGLAKQDIRYIFGGDLLGQLIGTTFGLKDLDIPVFGLYGACSTCGESLSLAAMITAAGYANHALAVTSSHYGSAEKQFRFPLEYGNQRPLSATWTVTGSGAFVVSGTTAEQPMRNYAHITAITTGKIVDYGVRDSMNMGACMAPAAADVIYQCLDDLNLKPSYFDHIITGDLGVIGSDILKKLLLDNGYDISKQHLDCGIMIYDNEKQDTHSGGSGCGCCAVTLAGYILNNLSKHIWERVLFVPTGALLSTVSFNEGQTIPGTAHALIIEQEDS